MTQIQVNLQNISEKVERTKSFNVDFNKIKKKDENESFRAETPKPLPYVSPRKPKKTNEKPEKLQEESHSNKKSL